MWVSGRCFKQNVIAKSCWQSWQEHHIQTGHMQWGLRKLYICKCKERGKKFLICHILTNYHRFHHRDFCKVKCKQKAIPNTEINFINLDSRGPFSKYLGWNKSYSQLDKSHKKDFWSQKQATLFPWEESVQNLNWVTDWFLPCMQGINYVTANVISVIKEFQPMRLKTGFDVLNKQLRGSFLCFLEVWLSYLWLNFKFANIRQLNLSCLRKRLCFDLSDERTYLESNWRSEIVHLVRDVCSMVGF